MMVLHLILSFTRLCLCYCIMYSILFFGPPTGPSKVLSFR